MEGDRFATHVTSSITGQINPGDVFVIDEVSEEHVDEFGSGVLFLERRENELQCQANNIF